MQDTSGKTENVQRRNRQSILETEYHNFHAHERFDALLKIEECRETNSNSNTMAEIHDRRLACVVFEVHLVDMWEWGSGCSTGKEIRSLKPPPSPI